MIYLRDTTRDTGAVALHKATPPRTGYRDAAVFLVHPALARPWPWDEGVRRTYGRNCGYCINPFSDRPLRAGDE